MSPSPNELPQPKRRRWHDLAEATGSLPTLGQLVEIWDKCSMSMYCTTNTEFGWYQCTDGFVPESPMPLPARTMLFQYVLEARIDRFSVTKSSAKNWCQSFGLISLSKTLIAWHSSISMSHSMLCCSSWTMHMCSISVSPASHSWPSTPHPAWASARLSSLICFCFLVHISFQVPWSQFLFSWSWPCANV
jgi:hypothetical protein